MARFSLAALAVVALSIVSCKKHNTDRTTCATTLYGYSVPDSAAWVAGTTSTFGIINPSSGSFSGLGTFIGSGATNQATYNSADDYYYAFSSAGVSMGTAPLYKISPTGTFVAISGPTGFYSSLKFNPVTNKLYCIKSGHLAEVAIIGTTFSTTDILTPVHPYFYTYSYLSVDNTSGDMYYVTGDTSTSYIEKYHPGSSASTVVATSTGTWDLYGLCFNHNDNMLYAIRKTNPVYSVEFIQVDPAAGTVTSLATLSSSTMPNDFNNEFYSAVIDQCNNRYILSMLTNGPTLAFIGVLQQYSMTGALLQADTTATFYQGLDVK